MYFDSEGIPLDKSEQEVKDDHPSHPILPYSTRI